MIKNYTGSIVRRSLTAVSAVALSAALLGTVAQAGPIVGSDAFTQQNSIAIGALPPGSNVNNATSFTNIALSSNTPSSGDFLTFVPNNTDVNSGVTVPVASGPSSFSFGDAAFGTFTATTETVIFQGSGFANLSFTGTFVPGTLFPASITSNSAIFQIAFTQSGTSITDAASITTPAGVPEPTSMALLGIGITGFLAFRRRFSKSKKLPVA
jgi:hypothetical protein